jgi:predicted small lipoprotein YifL
MSNITKIILALTLVLGLSACGIKGGLDLPEDDNEQNTSKPSSSY